jgi:hypothetical protein
MKLFKWMFAGVFAVVLFLGLNAFTSSNKTANQATNTEYYFYEVDGNGEIDPDAPLNPGDPQTIAEFVDPVGCDPGDNEDCIRAWETGHLPTVSGEGEYEIRKE